MKIKKLDDFEDVITRMTMDEAPWYIEDVKQRACYVNGYNAAREEIIDLIEREGQL